MLKKLRLQNFRTYLDAEINFTQRHLLIGRNNSGKTNLYRALRFLRDSARGDLATAARSIPGGIAEMKYAALDSNIIQLSCDCQLPFEGVEHEFSYSLKLNVETVATSASSPHSQLELHVRSEELTVSWQGSARVALISNDGHEATILNEDAFVRTKQDTARLKHAVPPDGTMLSKTYDRQTNPRAVLFRDYLSSWRLYNLDPVAIRRDWQTSKPEFSVLNDDGSNLATVLYLVKSLDGPRFLKIMNHVRRLEPKLEDIGFFPVPGRVPTPFLRFSDRGSTSWEGLSDGTLRFLALVHLAESVPPLGNTSPEMMVPFTIIEEPENGLYPGLLRELLEVFEERGASGQFVFTSHSPYFINLFDCHRESVTFLRRSDGPTEVRPVPPPDDADPDRLLLAEEYSMELLD